MKQSVHRLDIQGVMVPISLLKITQAFREIKTGEILEILSDDPDTREDLFRVLKIFHYQLINIQEKNSSYCIQLKKTDGKTMC